MTFASDMYDTALDMLTEFGQAVTFVRDNTGSFSPLTGVVSDSSDDSYSGYGYPSNYNYTQIDNTIIRQSDILLVLSTPDTPQVNDIFTIGSESYTALDIQKITVAGQNIIYKVQLR